MEAKYYCRRCKGLRNYKVVCEKKTKGSEDLDWFQWNDDFYIIECLGCSTISFLKIYGDSEMTQYNEEGEMDYFSKVDIYPNSLEEGNEIEPLYYLPDKIGNIYGETISTFKAN